MFILFVYYWVECEFGENGLILFLGSGFYWIGKFEVGCFVEYECVDDYWVKDLVVCKGCFNFDCICYDYYIDDIVVFEVFKVGSFDFWVESLVKNWVIVYDGEKFDDGRIIVEVIEYYCLIGMQGFVFNM